MGWFSLISAQADTAVLAGPVVVVATTDETGKVTAFNVTDLNKAEADGFLVATSLPPVISPTAVLAFSTRPGISGSAAFATLVA